MNHSEIVWPLEEIRRDVAEIGGEIVEMLRDVAGTTLR